jgi:hypothetical protein
MIAVLSWLKTHRRDAQISLICSGNEDGTDTMYGLCDNDDEKIKTLFNKRVYLNQDDIEFADYVWQLYCSDNPIRLENMSDFEHYHFDYLSNAIKVHLKRFPSIKNGLNELENRIMQLAVEQKPKNKKELVQNIMANQGYYGYGDTQFDRIITSLKPLFTSYSPIRLSKKGKDIVEGKTSFYSQIRDNESYLGGALKYNFLYNDESGRILKL